MAARPVRRRERGAADIDEAADYYLAEASAEVALRFIDAIERAISQISRSPKSGSLRFSYELEIPDLRVRPAARFPYLVFYVVGDEAVDVWRILHTRRDALGLYRGMVGIADPERRRGTGSGFIRWMHARDAAQGRDQSPELRRLREWISPFLAARWQDPSAEAC